MGPSYATDMWGYMCFFAELYLGFPQFGNSFFGGGCVSLMSDFVRVLGPLPELWKESYCGVGKNKPLWYDPSKKDRS
jgi:hypothetical protein